MSAHVRWNTAWGAVVLLFGVGIATAVPRDTPEPQIEGPWWQVAGNPMDHKYATAKQEPVDFALWQAADGTWQLWSCLRNTTAGGQGGLTRFFYRWEGKRLTDADWRPLGIAMEADPALGEQVPQRDGAVPRGGGGSAVSTTAPRGPIPMTTRSPIQATARTSPPSWPTSVSSARVCATAADGPGATAWSGGCPGRATTAASSTPAARSVRRPECPRFRASVSMISKRLPADPLEPVGRPLA